MKPTISRGGQKMIYLLRKPFKGSLAENALAHKCGGLNIDVCRISTSENLSGGAYAACPTERYDGKENWRYARGGAGAYRQPTGRWPANFILVGDSPVKELDRQSGVSKSAGGRIGNSQGVYSHLGATGFKDNAIKGDPGFGDTGGASRFFIQFRLEEK